MALYFSDKELEDLIKISQDYPRRRALKAMQEDSYIGPHVSLNIIQPDSYIQPHLRYNDESIIWHSGKLVSIQLEDVMKVKGVHILSKDSPYLFLPKNTYHTVISLEKDSALWMVVQGAHNPTHFSRYLEETPTENNKREYGDYFEFLKNIATSFS